MNDGLGAEERGGRIFDDFTFISQSRRAKILTRSQKSRREHDAGQCCVTKRWVNNNTSIFWVNFRCWIGYFWMWRLE